VPEAVLREAPSRAKLSQYAQDQWEVRTSKGSFDIPFGWMQQALLCM
jgi:hypothetical protein